ncbi:MAG: Bax inhibitor-1 family protein [Lachnospiraceae bacterium]|nr:Bax inhibitor-1 family protein [Lachnospiraceae bacterium]
MSDNPFINTSSSKKSTFNKKQERFSYVEPGKIISDRAYSALIGLITAYGLIMNFVICRFFSDYFIHMNYATVLIAYIIGCIVGVIMVNASKNPVVSFIGYNLVVIPLGIVLSLCLVGYDPTTVFHAIGMTASVVVIMLCLSMLFPQVFLKMGRVLFASLLVSVVVSLIFAFLGIASNLYSFIVAIIFSLYIGYDWAKAMQYPKTVDNAVDSACDIYLDIINLFLRILSIMARSKD